MPRPDRRETERRWHRLTEEFLLESDRGAALVAAALLDANLEDLLRAFMVPDQREVEYLLGSNLQSLGARVRACYCLGLLSEDECNDLRIIKEIRNHFAHNLLVSFEDQAVQKRCADLRIIHRVLPLERRPKSDRRALEQSTCMLSVLLVARTRSVRGQRRRKRRELDQMDIDRECPLAMEGTNQPASGDEGRPEG